MRNNPHIFIAGGKVPASTTLQHLELNNCGINEGVDLQLQRFPLLERLYVNENPKIDHSQLETLLESKEFSTLFIEYSNITKFPAKSIFDFSPNPGSPRPDFFLAISDNPELDLPKEGPARYLLGAAAMCGGTTSFFKNTNIDIKEVEKYYKHACNIFI